MATPASATSRCRWRSEPAGALLAVALAHGGCERAQGPSLTQAVARSDDARVVAMVAARDGLDAEAARQRVEARRRIAADALAGADLPEALLSPSRRAHLARTAAARVALADLFEASHGAEDIPDDDPMLQRARADGRFVHPRLHRVCQVIATPPGKLEGDALAAALAAPGWEARATEVIATLRRHVEATVPLGDPQACALMLSMLRLEHDDPDDDVVLRGEGGGGFDLTACAVAPAADGSCSEPRFAPEWTAVIGDGPTPGVRGPFTTRFGVHLALVLEVLPARGPDDPGFDAEVREAVLLPWRTEAFGRWLEQLRTRHVALIASDGGGAP
ncbi:MAG: hypothetical protein IPH07_06980 [Deltaproteobacteria bacterium]|nr:hypothetical protein [Deltaproteobacteria bacterium]MBK8236479.1 hypothetical protein [Deltaproteobacteria bacterium]MBP7288298.1 hypothetical protein [Nannocystaceae bacterium]